MAPERARSWAGVAAGLVTALLLSSCGGAGADSETVRSDPPSTTAAADTTTAPTGDGGTSTTRPEPASTSTSTTTTSSTTSTTLPAPAVPSGLPLLPTTSTTVPDPMVDPPAPVAPPEGPPGRNSVFVVGDSVFLGTTSVIPTALAEWLVTYDASGNRRLAQAIDLLRDRRGEIGEAVVIHLGNNFIPGERGTYTEQIDEAMSVLADVPRVVWVTVAEVSDSRQEINRSIRDAAERWPNLRVADWAAVTAHRPELSWDGLHLTPDGRREMAALIAATLGPVDRS